MLTNTPLFGIILSLLCYEAGIYINKKLHTPIANPLLLAIIFCITFLKIFNIPFEDYNNGGSFISLFLLPATAALSLNIYNNFNLLKKNIIPVFLGSLIGSLTSIGSVIFFCKIFNVEDTIKNSLIPKSVTTPIAMEISKNLNGIPSITVAIVIVTGILGAVLCPLLIKIFKIKEPVAVGLAIGSCSHAVGTSKAIEIGHIEGAISSIAIGLCGIFTVLISCLL